ncbi:MAG: protein kinase [Chloroflexota bacterium]|nr:MAG: protein kinase [Chloroflexota bacterium]
MTTSNARSRPAAGKSSKLDPGRPDNGHDLQNYRLIERVGQEELATVYRASHIALDRPVLVHVLRRTDWISASRFQLAGKLAARLSHPNILPVIDAGHDDRYGDYIVTPQLDARPLEEHLAGGPLGVIPALRIFSQIGTALDFLHSEGIVHRDVQPANILVTPQGTAYLTNFSLAAGPETPDFSEIDDADYQTPYSAPEQSFAAGQPSPAQDLYSLGVVLYQMLSGEIPPPGGPPPSLAEHNPALAGADRVIARLMAAQPSQRYGSAAQAIAALRQALRQQLDDATGDMEESRWEAVAEWLENPLETVAGDLLDSDFVSRSRSRADGLHRVDAVRRQLDRWSRQGLLRRPLLGQIIQPEQIVSYNVYLYELRAHYETRTQPQTRQVVHHGGALTGLNHEMDLWSAPVPEQEPFIDAPPETMVIPGSQRIVPCGECNGATKMACKTCSGKGTVTRTQRVTDADGKSRNETFQEDCPTCRGYGTQDCPRCEGTGSLMEEKVFTWSRHGRAYFTEDDISGLHKLTIQAKAQEVYRSRIDPREGRWYQVAPLKEALEEALKGGGPDARLIAAELIIKGVPVTEVDYRYRDKPHTLQLIGFDNTVRGDSSLYDMERIYLYAVIAVMAIILAVVLLLG